MYNTNVTNIKSKQAINIKSEKTMTWPIKISNDQRNTINGYIEKLGIVDCGISFRTHMGKIVLDVP